MVVFWSLASWLFLFFFCFFLQRVLMVFWSFASWEKRNTSASEWFERCGLVLRPDDMVFPFRSCLYLERCRPSAGLRLISEGRGERRKGEERGKGEGAEWWPFFGVTFLVLFRMFSFCALRTNALRELFGWNFSPK